MRRDATPEELTASGEEFFGMLRSVHEAGFYPSGLDTPLEFCVPGKDDWSVFIDLHDQGLLGWRIRRNSDDLVMASGRTAEHLRHEMTYHGLLKEKTS